MENRNYSTVAIVLHWTIALVILGQIASGLYMHNLPNTSSIKFDMFQLHKSFGLSVLALSLLRLAWRFTHKPPTLPVAMPGWQKLAARMTHIGFYVLMIATPLAGLAMVSVSPLDIPTKLFGVVPVPHFPLLGIEDREGAEDILKEVHEYLAFGILGLLALHVGAALKHGLINRDGVLRSMSPAKAGLGIGLIFAAFGVGVAAYFSASAPTPPTVVFETVVEAVPTPEFVAPVPIEAAPVADEPASAITPSEVLELPVAAPDGAAVPVSNDNETDIVETIWIVDTAASQLVFIGEEKGRAFKGAFGGFQATINFDPNNLEASTIRVDVATVGLSTSDQLRDSTIPGKEWFHVKEYPTASFTSTAIRNVGGDAYEADGVLQIKTYEHPITLAFTLIIDGDNANASGAVDLIRTNYGLGLGSGWIDDEDVALNVRVEFEINATRKG
ncbi:MAG: hypothetical protein GXP04_06305 [Alphaproteobacteria bacterium]|nr:hypothetical protein [Alphaproteobacteria bacterium]